MAKVLLGIGSNIDREENIVSGLGALSRLVDGMKLSPVYETSAVGFDGEDFFNLVVSGNARLPLGAFAREIKRIEFEHGRLPTAKKFSSRRLDIDILTYGNLVGNYAGVTIPRSDITEYAYVLLPLARLEPDMRHPATGERYSELWEKFQSCGEHVRLSNFLRYDSSEQDIAL